MPNSSARDDLRYGFLLECSRSGLSADEICEFAEKVAAEKASVGPLLASLLSAATSGVSSVAGTALPIAGAAMLAAPPAAGYLAGRTLADLEEREAFDPEDIRTQELIDEYRRQRQQLIGKRRSFRAKL